MNDISELFAQYNGGDFTASVLQGLGGTAPPTISLKDDRFSFVDSAGERTPHASFSLKVIVIGVNPHGPSKLYWGRDYKDNVTEGERPLCWSDNGVGPSQQSLEPQSQTCRDCDHNRWGSATSNMTGKGIKACQDRKKLAVIVPEHNSETVWLLSVPPASFGNLAAYVKKLAGHSMNGRQVQLFDVVTELSMEDKELQFKPIGQVEDQAKERILGIWKAGTVKEVTGANDVPIRALLTAPKETKVIEVQRVMPPPLPGGPSNGQGSPTVETPVKRGPGRPKKLEELPADPSRSDAPDDVPAFLKARGGVVAEPEKPTGGLMDALNQAFKLNLSS